MCQGLSRVVVLALCVLPPSAAPRALSAQFDEVPIPAEIARLDFMVGNWTVRGGFRTPDLIAENRTLWYATDLGVTRFDGRSWVAWKAGEDATADTILSRIQADGPGAPFQFENTRTVTRIQDGFALLVDDGRTAGTRLLYFDPVRATWGQRAFHAPSGSFTFPEGTGTVLGGVLTLMGTGSDRRGERLIRTRFVPEGPDRYAVYTDISFDQGRHWLIDQIVQDVVRR